MIRNFGTIVCRHKAKCYGPSNVLKRNVSNENHFDDPGAPRIAVTKNGKTIAMFHPKHKLTYEKTIPIPRHDPKYNYESVEAHVEFKLEQSGSATKPTEPPSTRNMYPMWDREIVPTIMELANMFHTTKHRWFPDKVRDLKKDKDAHKDRPFD